MKKSWLVLLIAMFASIAHAERVYQTALLKDEVGFVGSDGSKVTNVVNMVGLKDKSTGKVNWQWRHIFIDLPIETNDVETVEVFLANGDAIEFGEEPDFWPDNKFVKLWLVSEEGFEFLVRITFKESL